MPGFAAHYLFGVSTFRRLDKGVVHNYIQSYHHAYALGLQGPDIFFYYLPSLLLKPNPGSAAHTQRVSEFLTALAESSRQFPNEEDRQIALCYFAGFVGHYTLDTTCHPYVYDRTHFKEQTPDYFGRHVYLETDIDKELLMRCRQLLPSGFRQNSTIRLSARERRVVARCLYDTYHRVFPELKLSGRDMYLATLTMPFGVFVLHDPYGKKKVFVRRVEKHFPGYPYVSPLIPSDKLDFTRDPLNLAHRTWKNPWDTSILSTDSFIDLFHAAQKTYLRRLEQIRPLFDYNGTSTIPSAARWQAQLKTLTEDLGNCSYGSGLPL